eukprot:103730-Rhodomonas_salina.1
MRFLLFEVAAYRQRARTPTGHMKDGPRPAEGERCTDTRSRRIASRSSCTCADPPPRANHTPQDTKAFDDVSSGRRSQKLPAKREKERIRHPC